MAKTPPSLDERVRQVAAHLGESLPNPPPIAFLSCLGLDVLESIPDRVTTSIPVTEIPGWPSGDSEARVVIAEIEARSPSTTVLLIQGGPPYEIHGSLAEACLPMWALKRLGGSFVFLINAARGLRDDQSSGNLFAVRDHIDQMRDHPLVGHDYQALGPSYPDMSRVYDADLTQCLMDSAGRLGLPLREGILAARSGPCDETPAECQALARSGADAIAHSMVPEAIAAHHAGVRVAALSVLLDVNPPPHRQTVSLDSMVDVAEEAAQNLRKLLRETVHSLIGILKK